MGSEGKSKNRNIVRHLFVYLGGAWVFIEALNFLIDKYYWNSEVLDILILLVIFGLPAMVIFLWFERRFPKKAIILQTINAVVLLGVIMLSITRPGSLNPNEISLIRFQKNQIKLASNIRSLAVLPFSNYTGEENNQPTVYGMHDALISELGRIGAIRVISKTSTLPYSNSDKTVKEIAADLKVDAIIETSVLKVTDKIKITVKLVNAVPEQQLWSRTFDAKPQDFIDLYHQIVSQIAAQLEVALSPNQQSFLDTQRPVNPEAYRLYLEGVYYSETLTEHGFKQALDSFDKSLELDSLYAPAYAGLAFAWIAGLQMRYITVAEAIPEIYGNNLKALNIDPDYPEAHYINALMSAQGEWNWEKSENAFRKAIEGNPNHVLSHAYFSHILMF